MKLFKQIKFVKMLRLLQRFNRDKVGALEVQVDAWKIQVGAWEIEYWCLHLGLEPYISLGEF